MSVGFVPDKDGGWVVPAEVFITSRGKTGTELDGHLYELGVAVSKMMQGE